MAYCRRYFIALIAIFIAACSTNNTVPDGYVAKSEFKVPDSTVVLKQRDNRIAPLDMVAVDVFSVKDLSRTYQVDYSGVLKMPLIGGVQAAGLTSFELAEKIENRLGAEYIQNPEVNISFERVSDERITVDGTVKNPGIYDIAGETTLLQAIALAGGLGELADTKQVLVFRNIDGNRAAAGFNVTKIREGVEEDPRVYGNDLIVVDGSKTKATHREILKNIPLLSFFFLL